MGLKTLLKKLNGSESYEQKKRRMLFLESPFEQHERLTLCLELHKQSPHDVDVLVYLALTLRRYKRYDEAERYVRNALEINSHFAPAKELLAEILAREGKYGEAVNIYENLSHENKYEMKLTPYLSALCNYLTGNIDRSRILIQKAIKLNPADDYCCDLEDEIEGRVKYGVDHFFDSEDASINHFLEVEASRESPPGEATLCYGASEAIRTKELQCFQAAVQQTQNNVSEDFVELVMGFLKWKMGDSDEALPHLQKAVELERSTQNVMCLARVYREMPDRKSEARQLYDSVLKESPDEFEAMWSLGMLADDSEKALGYYREASKVRSTDWRIHLSIGQTLAEMGRYSEAIEAYNSARYYCGENPSDISLSTAKAYIHLDKRDLAISYAEQACHEDPTSQKAKDLYASIKEVN